MSDWVLSSAHLPPVGIKVRVRFRHHSGRIIEHWSRWNGWNWSLNDSDASLNVTHWRYMEEA